MAQEGKKMRIYRKTSTRKYIGTKERTETKERKLMEKPSEALGLFKTMYAPERRLRPAIPEMERRYEAQQELKKRMQEAYAKGRIQAQITRARKLGRTSQKRSILSRYRSPYNVSGRPSPGVFDGLSVGAPQRSYRHSTRTTAPTFKVPGQRGRPRKIENLSPQELRMYTEDIRQRRQMQQELQQSQMPQEETQEQIQLKKKKEGVSADISTWTW